MTLAATFLGGAKSRLLPPSLPFRFFAAAAVFHVLLWLVLLLAAGNATSFAGGFGPALAVVHLLTLGVLTMTAIGAATQILPVATRRPLTAVWLVKLVFWLTVPGIMVLIAGMYAAEKHALLAGASATTAGLALFAWLFAEQLAVRRQPTGRCGLRLGGIGLANRARRSRYRACLQLPVRNSSQPRGRRARSHAARWLRIHGAAGPRLQPHPGPDVRTRFGSREATELCDLRRCNRRPCPRYVRRTGRQPRHARIGRPHRAGSRQLAICG